MLKDQWSSTMVIMAALNEEEGIGSTLAEIQSCMEAPFCLVVDGRSSDQTIQIAEATGAKVITQTGKGKGDALAAALAFAKSFDLKYAALIDADFTYPAKYLPTMVEMLEKNSKAGMICGDRFSARTNPKAMRMMFNFGNRLLSSTHNLLNGINLNDPLTGLRVVRWEAIRDWKPRSKGFDIEVELNCHVDAKGYKIVEIPISYRARLGEKKLKLRHGFTILRRIIGEGLAHIEPYE